MSKDGSYIRYRVHRSLRVSSRRVLRSSPDIFRERIYIYIYICTAELLGQSLHKSVRSDRIFLLCFISSFFLSFSSELEYINSVLNTKKNAAKKFVFAECFSSNTFARILSYEGSRSLIIKEFLSFFQNENKYILLFCIFWILKLLFLILEFKKGINYLCLSSLRPRHWLHLVICRDNTW